MEFGFNLHIVAPLSGIFILLLLLQIILWLHRSLETPSIRINANWPCISLWSKTIPCTRSQHTAAHGSSSHHTSLYSTTLTHLLSVSAFTLQRQGWIAATETIGLQSLKVFIIWALAQLVKNLPAMQEIPFWFLGWEDPLEKGMTPVFWPGEFHGLYSPWGHKESDTDWAAFTFTFTEKVYWLLAFFVISNTVEHMLMKSGIPELTSNINKCTFQFFSP